MLTIQMASIVAIYSIVRAIYCNALYDKLSRQNNRDKEIYDKLAELDYKSEMFIVIAFMSICFIGVFLLVETMLG